MTTPYQWATEYLNHTFQPAPHPNDPALLNAAQKAQTAGWDPKAAAETLNRRRRFQMYGEIAGAEIHLKALAELQHQKPPQPKTVTPPAALTGSEWRKNLPTQCPHDNPNELTPNQCHKCRAQAGGPQHTTPNPKPKPQGPLAHKCPQCNAHPGWPCRQKTKDPKAPDGIRWQNTEPHPPRLTMTNDTPKCTHCGEPLDIYTHDIQTAEGAGWRHYPQCPQGD